MMQFFYILFTRIYPFVIRIAGLFSPKAKLWTNGRKDIFQKIEQKLSGNQQPVIWFHCASLGEFEQGRTIIEKIKASFPTYKICITFFSPSGYEIRKNYALADYIFYLPMDSASNASKFVQIVQPKMAFFVKYEFWHFYIRALKRNNIPLYSLSTLLRKDQIYFKSYGNFYRNILRNVHYFFVQNQSTKTLLESIQIENVQLSGDTRYDRVIEISEQWQPIQAFAQLDGSRKILVAGSIWPEDDENLKESIAQHPKHIYILAPHEIKPARIKQCLENFPNAICFSKLNQEFPSEKNTLIIDNIGMLNKLYRYADIAYIGGAWGHDGIHNILEAAVYGKPVLYGPNHKKSFEAQNLVDFGGGFSAQSKADLETQLNALFTNNTLRAQFSEKAKDFVFSQKGATDIIWEYIYPILQQMQ